MKFRCLGGLNLAQHQLFERCNPSLHFNIGLTKVVNLRTELFGFRSLSLEFICPLAQLFNRRQTHTGKILHTDGSIAGAKLKRFEEIFSHRSHVANTASLGNVVPCAHLDAFGKLFSATLRTRDQNEQEDGDDSLHGSDMIVESKPSRNFNGNFLDVSFNCLQTIK